jgi:ATP synthase in type III secretion protein N
MSELLEGALDRLEEAVPLKVRGRVTDLVGLVMRATLPSARLGDTVVVLRPPLPPLDAEVIGFSEGRITLVPLGEPEGVGPGSLVESRGGALSIRCGPSLLGRVLDGLGRPIDGGPPLESSADLEEWPIDRPAPAPLERPRVTRPLTLGIRAIDGLATVGEGQRLGLLAGSGVGKSTLLGQIARSTEADVTVIGLVGERGREVRDFIETALGPAGLSRSVVVVATSDSAPLVRLKSAAVATAVAEHFRERGQRVLLLVDSLTRYARALREIALAAGEPPARRGYPPSVFARLPRLLERAGSSSAGSITAIYTVLVEGDDLEEPISDEVRAILDGQIVLSRDLAERSHFPAIDVLRSLSRLMPQLADDRQLSAAARLRRIVSTYERRRELILLGAYRPGSDPETDHALARIAAVESFLRQGPLERCSREETLERLHSLTAEGTP